MSIEKERAFENFLNEQRDEAWASTLAKLLPSIHEVDRTATSIWFAFYPVSLWRALRESADADGLMKRLLMQGDFYLKDQIDSSHTFFYGHRYWPEVKRSLAEHAANFMNAPGAELEGQIEMVARDAAKRVRADESLLVGITAVAFMTALQAGFNAFKASPGTVQIDRKHAKKSPEQILSERAKDDSQGLFGFLKTVDKEWTVTYDENEDGARFKSISGEELASAAARDRSRDWRTVDARCVEGPIPVECRAASCGTCWVGILGGAEKLSPVGRLEGRRIKEFGYINTEEPKPIIRLACMAQASGAVSIVIPPWNAQFGKHLGEKNGGAGEEETAHQEVAN
ncbi:MAG TPA: hypothetical protein VK619_06480 [Pyrinomonadaceae bacterium]|nr:hypothetical protein [Pyrinomonadaceae bacterium]